MPPFPSPTVFSVLVRRISPLFGGVDCLQRRQLSVVGGERVRRSLFNVPGSEERKLKKSSEINADSVVLDLEDGVAFNRKEVARTMVLDALNHLELKNNAERAVRINHVGSGLEVEDLRAVLRSPRLEALVIPKVEHSHQVKFVATMIDTLVPPERRGQIRLLAAIESALGLLNLREIATSEKRLDALIVTSLPLTPAQV